MSTQSYYVVCSYMVENYETKNNEYRFESEILKGDPDDMESTITKWNTYFKDKIGVNDEDIRLRVKSSLLIFREAHDTYKNDMRQFGKTNKSQEDYITKTMEKFGTNAEVNTYGINKLVNAILASNGHYEEMISGSELQNSKFSMLIPPKQDYGLAYLRLKFREKGLDIDNLKVSQDLTELKHNGVSKVIIDFKIRKYEKTVTNVNTHDLQYS